MESGTVTAMKVIYFMQVLAIRMEYMYNLLIICKQHEVAVISL